MARKNGTRLTALLIYIVLRSCPLLQAQASYGIDPLSIPLAVRQSCYNKGNLVPNASFEQKLTHWSVVGKNVELTDTADKARYTGDDAFHSRHAVRISRTFEEVDEVGDQAYGILSDYIRVIPANFDLYFDIRAEKIIPSTYLDRFTTRIDKNIDIHLVFYDKDKKEISPGIWCEYINRKIDNSFKGFAFSNYPLIDRFPWARIHGETWTYPFSEGDMPENCAYVRIFFGLKCSGTIWVDNVDLRLSRWNFTPEERTDSFFHRQYSLAQLLIPTPRSVSNEHRIMLGKKSIRIICPDSSSPESRSALLLLRQRLGKVRHVSLTIGNAAAAGSSSRTEIGSSSRTEIVLLHTGTAPAGDFDEAFAAIRGKDQGYFIRSRGSRIYLGANTSVGWFYAVTTLCQLIDDQNVTIDCADITDYPEIAGRSVVLMAFTNKWSLQQNKTLADSAIAKQLARQDLDLQQQVKDLDFYAFYKLNELYSVGSFSKKWWEPGDFFARLYQTVGKRCAGYGDILNTAVTLNPYMHFGMEESVDSLTDSLRNLFSIGSDAGFEKIKNVLRIPLDAGAKTVMFCSDDMVPHTNIIRGEYSLFTPEDRKQFTNLAAAQAFLANRTKRWIDDHYKGVRFEFIPPPYNNRFIDNGRGTAEPYFRDLDAHLDSNIAMVWTGNTVRSLSYDLADIRRATRLYGRKPMIFDNTPYARFVEIANGGYPINYPARSSLCNIFEPFDIQYPDSFATYLDSRYYSNLNGFGDIDKLKYLSFADFTWNPGAYNPDFALFKSLVRYVGRKNAPLLLQFNAAYYDLVTSWGLLRIDKAHDPAFQCTTEQKSKAGLQIKALQRAFAALAPIDNPTLKKQLEELMTHKISEWRILSGYGKP
ncbi:MAG TPA: beta-N-acetylglucosaminidase domain-containing protein [Puia sp.]|nr:beta-N-acetylglucosaminidase domain-containing protein [Puia sp.]